MISDFKDTSFLGHKSINVRGNLIPLSKPLIMGIINLTNDSFYSGGRYPDLKPAIQQCETMISQGVDILDLGACSTRPGAKITDCQQEIQALAPLVRYLRENHPNIIISIDTVHSQVVKHMHELGADIVNDVSAGRWDEKLFLVVAQCGMPYILTHSPAMPEDMQAHTSYDNLLLDIAKFFSVKIQELRRLGVKDIILDLGFGFGKTIEQNYFLLKHQKEFEVFSLPILTGISRKSMIYKPLNITPEEALNGTSVLHTMALQNGANILRVHDVKQAKECATLFELYNNN